MYELVTDTFIFRDGRIAIQSFAAKLVSKHILDRRTPPATACGDRFMIVAPGILASVGNTAPGELHRVVPCGCARVLVKLESRNPTGAMKSRLARSLVEGTVRSGDWPSTEPWSSTPAAAREPR